MVEEYYKFNLSFKGQLVENSVDAFDVANTILATSSALHEIAKINFGDDRMNDLRININAFQKGSLVSEFLIYIKDNAAGVVPLLPSVAIGGLRAGKEIISTLKTVLEVKEMLKGKKPTDVKRIDQNKISIVGDNNTTLIVTHAEFRAIQSKELSKDIAKMVQPLTKPQSELMSINIEDADIEKEIKRENAQYLENVDEIQTVSAMKYKGSVSKIDRKVCSGYIDVGSKRISFTYAEDLPDKEMQILIESLRTRIQILIIGEVVMDYENNPKQIRVTGVESEVDLFSQE